MRTILCMRWGTRYPAPYVNRLFAGVARHLDGPFRFVCLTDDPAGLRPEVEAHPLPFIPLPEALAHSPWRKLSVWQHPLAELEGDVLFLDLDMIVTGSLAPFFTHSPGAFCVAENWTQRGRQAANTSVFRFRPGRHTHLYDRFAADPGMVLARYRTEQAYVSAEIGGMAFWPEGWALSFKHDLVPPFPKNWWKEPALPKAARVVAFTGRPDIDEAARGEWPARWYKKIYKHARPAPWAAAHWREDI